MRRLRRWLRSSSARLQRPGSVQPGLETDPRVMLADPGMRMLWNAMVHEPKKFAPYVTQGLETTGLARQAGKVWAAVRVGEFMEGDLPEKVTALSVQARLGAAEVFARDAVAAADYLKPLFSDPDSTVRHLAASSLRYIEPNDARTANDLGRALVDSESFQEHVNEVLASFERLALSPDIAMDACERAVAALGEKTGQGIGDYALRLVLRLYREGDGPVRTRCMDVIDELSEIDLIGLEDAYLQLGRASHYVRPVSTFRPVN